ncbi:hypothetical protein OG268_08900 [Streptomyces uncialis]|nr:hypothetical protein OG268_08900 [Streptomyces uncialis]
MPHLVVDEGQDLSPGFYRLVRIAAVSVTVFADGCQRLTETNSTLNEITDALGRSTGRVEIARNHRNSRQIASLAEHFRRGGTRPETPFHIAWWSRRRSPPSSGRGSSARWCRRGRSAASTVSS